jgi:O-succinylbenzoic acid--CoA ligase
MAAMAPARLIDAHGDSHRLTGGRPVEPGDAVVVATSGTTGQPKGAVLTHKALAASAHATSQRVGVGTGDHWLACLPLAHVGGLSVVTRALATRLPVTVVPGPDRTGVEAAVRRGANLVSLVPTLLDRLDPTWFRVIVLGGSRPPATVPANAYVTYGLTETASGVVYDGIPLDGVEVRLGAEGEIFLRGPMLLRAYRDGSDPKDAAGWFNTGDLGTLDAEGRLEVRGRRGDLIISGGENVWPDAVEAVLATHAGVEAVAVVGVADREWGQRVVAVVVPTDPAVPPSLEELRDHAKDELGAWCAPRQLVLVEDLPTTALGKVQRGAVRADVEARARRKIV